MFGSETDIQILVILMKKMMLEMI